MELEEIVDVDKAEGKKAYSIPKDNPKLRDPKKFGHWSPEVYICEGDHIAMFGRCGWKNKATGKVADVRTAHLWKFKAGKVIEFTELFDSARVIAAAAT